MPPSKRTSGEQPAPKFFRDRKALRAWFEKNHAKKTEQWIGFYRKATGRASITWPESVDEALCFGWIDGLRRGIDDDAYMIRFTPRRRESIWSAVNIRRIGELMALGLVKPEGVAAFENRTTKRAHGYSYEKRELELDPAYVRRFKANKAAWQYFQAQRPSYRTAVTQWVMSAKRAETRERRLETLIADCAAGRWIKPMSYGKKN